MQGYPGRCSSARGSGRGSVTAGMCRGRCQCAGDEPAQRQGSINIWAMQANSIDDDIHTDTASATYTARGTVDNLTGTPEARSGWAKGESLIKQVLCLTLPDTTFETGSRARPVSRPPGTS